LTFCVKKEIISFTPLSVVRALSTLFRLTLLFVILPTHGQNYWRRDRSFDAEFSNKDPGERGAIYDFAFQPDGKVVAAGFFTFVNGSPCTNIVRLNPNGSIDPEFAPRLSIDAPIQNVSVDLEGRVILAGHFDIINEIGFNGLARLLPNGELDTSFHFDYPAVTIWGTVMQPDGKMLVFGHDVHPASVFGLFPIVRLEADATVDPSFTPGIYSGDIGLRNSVVLQPDGKILALGAFQMTDSDPSTALIRFLPNGDVDPEFLPDPIVNAIEAQSLALQPDGTILVGGRFDLIKLRPDGSRDFSFLARIGDAFQCIGVQPDGKIITAGYDVINRFSSSGSKDFSMERFPFLEGYAIFKMVSGPDGKVWFSGGETKFNGILAHFGMRRYEDCPRRFADWQAQYLANETVRIGPAESFLDDGIPNFVRYACNLAPKDRFENAPTIEDAIPPAEGKVSVLRINTVAEDVRFRFWMTNDLSKTNRIAAGEKIGSAKWTSAYLGGTTEGESGFLLVRPHIDQAFYYLTVEPK
jgi:uncharacterized delta-60 repeat protein